jgi:diguanylate cyclase (GGDEF)-like protein
MVNVAAIPAPLLLDLRELSLDDARALLEHEGVTTLPAPEQGPAAYLQAVVDGLCRISVKDPLTGLANRRHFDAVLDRELDGVARSGTSTLLLLLDIDSFKPINDTYGHLAGDVVLQAVARCIAGCVRPQDTVARYGGEEFALVLPDCPVPYGEAVAERIREAIAALSIPISADVQLGVTLSIGGAFAPAWVRSTTELWTERADTQLYLAKASGRNRVCIEQAQALSVSAEEKGLLFGAMTMDESLSPDNAPPAGERPGVTEHKVKQ